MNKYVVRVYVGTMLSILTQADHFEDFIFESAKSLEDFAKGIGANGFVISSGDKWIMPGAILSVEKK